MTCCIQWWPSRAISSYHISKATMQLSQFRPQVSQFNETNKDFSFKCQLASCGAKLTYWRSQLSTDLQSTLSTPNLQPFCLKYSLFSATLSHQSQLAFFKIYNNYQSTNVCMLTGNHPGCSLNELQALKGDGLQPYLGADILRKMGLSDLTSKGKAKRAASDKSYPADISHKSHTYFPLHIYKWLLQPSTNSWQQFL